MLSGLVHFSDFWLYYITLHSYIKNESDIKYIINCITSRKSQSILTKLSIEFVKFVIFLHCIDKYLSILTKPLVPTFLNENISGISVRNYLKIKSVSFEKHGSKLSSRKNAGKTSLWHFHTHPFWRINIVPFLRLFTKLRVKLKFRSKKNRWKQFCCQNLKIIDANLTMSNLYS